MSVDSFLIHAMGMAIHQTFFSGHMHRAMVRSSSSPSAWQKFWCRHGGLLQMGQTGAGPSGLGAAVLGSHEGVHDGCPHVPPKYVSFLVAKAVVTLFFGGRSQMEMIEHNMTHCEFVGSCTQIRSKFGMIVPLLGTLNLGQRILTHSNVCILECGDQITLVRKIQITTLDQAFSRVSPTQGCREYTNHWRCTKSQSFLSTIA